MSSFFDQEFVADASQAQAEYTPIPEGDYTLVIEKAETKPTKAGTGERLNLQFKVDGGDFDGRKVFHGLNIRNPSDVAVAIAKKELHALLTLCKVAKITTADELVGLSFVAKVKVKRDERSGGLQNEVVLALRKQDATITATQAAPNKPAPTPVNKPAPNNGTWD